MVGCNAGGVGVGEASQLERCRVDQHSRQCAAAAAAAGVVSIADIDADADGAPKVRPLH